MVAVLGQALPLRAEPANAFHSRWFVEGGSDKGTNKVIASGEVVTSSRLLLVRLAVLQSDIVGTRDEGMLLARGEQLFGVSAGQNFLTAEVDSGIYCTLAVKAFSSRTGRVRTWFCMADADRNGEFETLWPTSCINAVFPNVNGRTRSWRGLSVIRYETRKPTEIVDGPRVGIRTGSFSSTDRQVRFAIFLGLGDETMGFGWQKATTRETQRAPIALLGAALQVHSRPAGLLDILVDREIPPQRTGLTTYDAC